MDAPARAPGSWLCLSSFVYFHFLFFKTRLSGTFICYIPQRTTICIYKFYISLLFVLLSLLFPSFSKLSFYFQYLEVGRSFIFVNFYYSH